MVCWRKSNIMQPAMQHHSAKSQHCICKRMLAKQTGIGHVGEYAHCPRLSDSDTQRLVRAPIQHNQSHKIRAQYQSDTCHGSPFKNSATKTLDTIRDVADRPMDFGLACMVKEDI